MQTLCNSNYNPDFTIDHVFLTQPVLSLARAAVVCSDRDYTVTIDSNQLAVLVDALEEAGAIVNETCPECKGFGWLKACLDSYSPFYIVECINCGGLIGYRQGTGRVLTPLFAHLRSPGLHTIDCWAINLILGDK